MLNAMQSLDAARAIRALEAWPDVTRLRGHAGQVILYRTHYPPGVFVVLAGVVRVVSSERRDGPRPVRLDAGRGPFAIPGPDQLDRRAAGSVELVTDADILFVPRSLVLSDEALRRCLVEAHLAERVLAPAGGSDR